MTETEMVRLFEGRTFLWDGDEYATEEDATAKETEYRELGFEVRSLPAGGRVLLYTRRSVSSAEET
jgi:hypothetical protein